MSIAQHLKNPLGAFTRKGASKKERKTRTTYVAPTEFDGLTLPELKIRVDALIAQYGPKAFIDLKLNEYSEGTTQFVCVDALETDEEMRKRHLKEIECTKRHIKSLETKLAELNSQTLARPKN